MQLIGRKETCSNVETSFLGSDAFGTTANQSERSLRSLYIVAMICYVGLKALSGH